MNKSGPVVVIEDDTDDQHILKNVFDELGYANEIKFFSDGPSALEYIQGSDVYPFIIISDINLPKLDGFALRRMIHTNKELNRKCIPYIFFSTSVNKEAVYDAYTMSVQGFFIKPDNYNKLVNTIRKIVEYWQECFSPSNFGYVEIMK